MKIFILIKNVDNIIALAFVGGLLKKWYKINTSNRLENAVPKFIIHVLGGDRRGYLSS